MGIQNDLLGQAKGLTGTNVPPISTFKALNMNTLLHENSFFQLKGSCTKRLELKVSYNSYMPANVRGKLKSPSHAREATLTYKALNSLAPQYLGELFSKCLQGSDRNLRSTETNLQIPFLRICRGQKKYFLVVE